ncbi:TetR/AcrR family transcriptional regulator C-terminal domain-containing protein [Umezawaea endophytica]|uniref:TetR/AcrR family transcriptional regulator C-terminal domain-containing protein n=1 Tax=Umezawaea endophytica TaxID=1654476 RepID=A0A9X3AL66_9PSEU|nr:TetR/AcrR family transcriptional regulator C-terminal domain-containing protein [Umezawaea endophytica]MCS7483975.1 TetR/AcrR family transcriptional regulator C-terminal domain-containing protein [Umezawaea endophytica]
MADERTSAGDPARTLQLLWREPAAVVRRGPRQGLTVDAVVDAATSLADTSGLEALTMRKVASALGVVAMTLYTYVPGKAELLDLMLDAAYGRMSRTSTAGQPWRARVTAVAAENRRLFETHPWAASVSTVRPLLGPGQMGKYEHELSALDGIGLSDVEVDAALTHVLSFVQAWARSAADAAAAVSESALTEEEWWAVNAPLLDRVLDPAVYPLATRVGSAAGAEHGAAYSPEFAYEFGLARVLDGLAALVER